MMSLAELLSEPLIQPPRVDQRQTGGHMKLGNRYEVRGALVLCLWTSARADAADSVPKSGSSESSGSASEKNGIDLDFSRRQSRLP